MMNKDDYSDLRLPSKEMLDKLTHYYTREWHRIKQDKFPEQLLVAGSAIVLLIIAAVVIW